MRVVDTFYNTLCNMCCNNNVSDIAWTHFNRLKKNSSWQLFSICSYFLSSLHARPFLSRSAYTNTFPCMHIGCHCLIFYIKKMVVGVIFMITWKLPHFFAFFLYSFQILFDTLKLIHFCFYAWYQQSMKMCLCRHLDEKL